MAQPFDRTQKNFNQLALDDPHLLSGPFWGELRVFLAVAKAKSFNRAAEALNMSQPTVSRQVRRLQDVIGSQLVISTPSGITLTKKGQELAESLLTLDEKLFEISREMKTETREAEGLVQVSVTEALAGLFIVPSLVPLGERYPKIHLHIRNPVNFANFRENQTDVMIAFAPFNQAGVTSHPLGHIHFIPVASHGYIKRFGIPTRKNIESHNFVDNQYYAAQTGVWDDWHAAISRGVVVHHCDNSYAYGLMVKSGLGIGLLGSYTLSDATVIPLELGIHIQVPIHIAALSERLLARPVRLVYEWLSAVFAPGNPWFAQELNLRDLPRDTLSETAERLIALPLTNSPVHFPK